MGFITPKADMNSFVGGVQKKWLPETSSYLAKRGTIIGGDSQRKVFIAGQGLIGYNYGPRKQKSYAREIPIDKRTMGGPGSWAATAVRNQILERNQRMQDNRQVPAYMNPAKVLKQSSAILGLGRMTAPGAEQRAKAKAYFFEGQYGSSTTGLKSKWEINDSMQVLGGVIPASDIARATNRNFGDKTLTNLPPNYYLGLGNQIKGPDKRYAEKLTDLRRFGALGSVERDTTAGQQAELFRRIAWIRDMNMRLRAGPMDHQQPDAPGEFQLGAMQGHRTSAWERRNIEKMQELEKKKLHRVGTGERFQQEATQNVQASDRGTM